MTEDGIEKQNRYLQESRMKSCQRITAGVLAIVTALGTIFALIHPAVTLESECGLNEHTHGIGCYEQIKVHQVQVLNCEAGHLHTEECYGEDEVLLCPILSEENHVHSDGCFIFTEEIIDSDTLSCALKENENHEHSELCYGSWELICEISEHTHTDVCSPEIAEQETEPQETAETEEAYREEPESDEMALFSEPVDQTEETQSTSDASGQAGDIPVVAGDGIKFKLFNYSKNINKADGNAQWRSISNYFTFRDSTMTAGTDPSASHIPSPNMNTSHDEDGFTVHHATVERILDARGNPVLDLTRNADGTSRSDPGVNASIRSLAYLFSASNDHAVSTYVPSNTILQKSGTHYWYRSNSNAVDYDTAANLFRVRNYTERNSTTAGYGGGYGDFLPFTHTGGNIVGTNDDGIDYHVLNTDTDYWFGMTMEVNFFQTKDGVLGGENMVFSFSGDDDVWVFVDDVLVLDLGGTHGTVDGSINFATGEVRQYLSWNGANTTQKERTEGSATSFPTTIRDCFDAAGRVPKGGWNESGTSFANYTEHTLKFFYLERGAAVANCILDFALPTLPDKSLTVTKNLVAAEGAVAEFIEESLSYQFRVVKVDETGTATNELFIKPGMTYTLLENGVKSGTGTVDENGCFHLKAGQSAQFTEMLRKGGGATEYIVEEIMPDALTGQYEGVEYEVSGAGGDTKTGEGPSQEFSSFRTGVLSAEDTQTVTFRNRVDTQKLGQLRLTKRLASGSVFEAGQVFLIQVKLGDTFLPTGTKYMVGTETKTVTSPGIIELKADETAVILRGILSGTSYEVTELNSSGSFNASYSGVVLPEGTVNCNANGATGEFPLGSMVHITVTNASYDFSLQLPITKRVIDNQGSALFRFSVGQVDSEGNVTKELPGTTISVTNDLETRGRLVIGYDAGTEGVFRYRIREQMGNGNFIYDDTFYILEVAVSGGSAEVKQILKNGKVPVDELSFVNRKTTSLIVTKTVTGGTGAVDFSFSLTVTLDGLPFELPKPKEHSRYVVEGNVISFTLAHGEAISIPYLPIGADICIKESEYSGFLAHYQVAGIHDTPLPGDAASLTTTGNVQTVNFVNDTGYELPATGGAGTKWYTTGGMMLAKAAWVLSVYSKNKRRKEDQASS